MLLASLALLVPAVDRIPLGVIQNDATGYVSLGVADLCILVAVAVDALRNGRLHPALGWGAPILIVSGYLALVGARTDAWTRFATRLVS
jgi:hypothetical protein